MIPPEKAHTLTEQCRQAYGDMSAQRFVRLIEPLVGPDLTAEEELARIRDSGGNAEAHISAGRRWLHIDGPYFPPARVHREIGEFLLKEQKRSLKRGTGGPSKPNA